MGKSQKHKIEGKKLQNNTHNKTKFKAENKTMLYV